MNVRYIFLLAVCLAGCTAKNVGRVHSLLRPWLPIDIAIEGKGFIVLEDSNTGETCYTRSCSISLTADGALVIQKFELPGINIPPDAVDVLIGTDGTVTYQAGGNETTAGRIQMATFPDLNGLRRRGNVYFETEASGPAMVGNPGSGGRGVLRQGTLESSNVDSEDELRIAKETRSD